MVAYLWAIFLLFLNEPEGRQNFNPCNDFSQNLPPKCFSRKEKFQAFFIGAWDDFIFEKKIEKITERWIAREKFSTKHVSVPILGVIWFRKSRAKLKGVGKLFGELSKKAKNKQKKLKKNRN